MPKDAGLGGFSDCARAVNAAYHLAGPAAIDRRVLDRWYHRGTKNAKGAYPPVPVKVLADAKRTRPRSLFRPADWVEWVRPGVQVPGSQQYKLRFETMAERQARYEAGDSTPVP